jgi:subfamily B ATP-binding cassette protein MsbA
MTPATQSRRALRYLLPYVWPYFACAMICMVLFSGTNGILPFLVGSIFDDVFSNKDAATLHVLPVIIILTFVVRGALAFAGSYLTDYVGERIVTDIRNDLNEHIQRQSLAFFSRHPTGTLLTRVTTDVLLVGNALTDAVASVIRDSISLVVLIVVAFWHDWVLALIGLVAFPASVVPVFRLSQRMRRISRTRQMSLGKLTALLQETIQGNRVVKAFGMEDYERERFRGESERVFRLAMKVSRVRGFTSPMMEVLAAFGIAGVVWYGGSSVIAGGRTQGGFIAFLTALFLLYEPFKKVGRANGTIQQGLAASDRVFEILDSVPDVQDRPGARELVDVGNSIDLVNVSFRYDEDPVLSDINLRIARGEVVALVGPSGAGKSTLADLVLRYYDVNEGAIRIGGTDVRDVTLASLRQHIGLVTQHTFLFNDTVRNNIAYGGVNQNMEAVIAAAKAAYAHDFIMELPNGYDTEIGELGLRLSGGQRQRLAIARALLKNAPILVLDEATSALDNESERLVQQALETLMGGRTTLVIAHRLSTVRRADRIVVLVRGRVVEQGTHEELLALNAEYRRLHDMQFSDTAPASTLH